MSYSLDIRPLAILDAFEAFDYYEEQREGLGYEFVEELEAFYTRLLQNPSMYSYVEEPVRQGRLERFPYAIPYEIIEDRIVIYAIFMTAQDPEKKRLL